MKLYTRFVILLVTVLFVFGYALPWLFSAKDTLLVVIGALLMSIAIPAVVKISLPIYNAFKKKIEEEE